MLKFPDKAVDPFSMLKYARETLSNPACPYINMLPPSPSCKIYVVMTV